MVVFMEVAFVILFCEIYIFLSTTVNVHFLWQDAITSVSKEGRHLLLSLEISGKEDESQWDVRMDWETVQRQDIFSSPLFAYFYFDHF